MSSNINDDGFLILAAEDCPPDRFEALHRFSKTDEKLIRKLQAHGPVLLRGGRGSGKSAILIEAERRLRDSPNSFGVYLSMRHLELIRGDSAEYERFLCNLLIRKIQSRLTGQMHFIAEPRVSSVQSALSQLSTTLGRKVVLFFDDAAHIGREASLGDFFDIFRTISSSTVSCKAAIYPGVTKFGTRFDVYNDATVLELSRSEELDGFAELFEDVMEARYSVDLAPDKFSGMAPRADVAGLFGRAVLGNMRAFVFACNTLVERTTSGSQIGLSGLTETFLQLATNHYWPLLEELSPKLGVYKPMIEPARKIAEEIFRLCGQKDGRRFALVFRDITEKLAKPFEMLEYSGFVARREVSRAMKSGGRGARFAINLCNLLENVPGTRLTETLFRQWISEKHDPVDFHKGSELMLINLPELDANNDLEILSQPVSALAKSNAYPYGLTQAKIDVLREAGIHTVAELASATDKELLALKGVGAAFLVRYRNVVGQAIWM